MLSFYIYYTFKKYFWKILLEKVSQKQYQKLQYTTLKYIFAILFPKVFCDTFPKSILRYFSQKYFAILFPKVYI
jgi:hypothetical protein